MPAITDDSDMQTHAVGGSNFSFTGARIETLGATNYTLATIAVDTTGSVQAFEGDLLAMLRASIDACRKSPRSDNLLVRVVVFNGSVGVDELHGFRPLGDIDPAQYALRTGGMTNLYDACLNVVGATRDYARVLDADDFESNAIVFIITDGADNDSTARPPQVRDALRACTTDEVLESTVSILIGINAQQYKSELERFQREAELTSFVDAGDATPQRLAKLGQFVSRSISSTSQALGTGGPSQQIQATI